MKINNYEDAKIVLTRIMEDYPDSKERADALLLRSEVHYRENEYEEAAFNLTRFLEQYPAHPQADRAQYIKALCSYRMMDLATRDQTPTHKAIEEFDKLIRNFPNSKYRPSAEKKKRKCVENLALNQMEISRFYFRTSAFHSAINRLKNLLEKYPDQKFVDEAVFLLGESYYHEQNFDSARTYYMELLQKYPRSIYAQEARARLREIR